MSTNPEIRYVPGDEPGEQRREFVLTVKVSFAHDPGEDWEDGPDNYFQDNELIDLARDWMSREFEYHEDDPRVEFIDHQAPCPVELGDDDV